MRKTFGSLGCLLLAACRGPDGSIAVLSDASLQVAERLFAAEMLDSARIVFADVARGIDGVTEARALTGLALVERQLGRIDSAEVHVERAIEIWGELGRPNEAADAWNALGLIRLDQNLDQDGIGAFEQSLATARSVGDEASLGRASGNLGLAYAYRGDFVRAREAFRVLRGAGQSRADTRWEGNGLTNEAMIDLELADPLSAIARLDTARSLYRRTDYQMGEQVALGMLAGAYQDTGEYGAAFAALDTALALAQQYDLRQEEAVNIRLIADLHASVGDYRRAVDLFSEAEAILRETGATADLGATLRGAAGAYARLGTSLRATEMANAALQIDRGSGEQPAELEDLVLLASLEATGAPPPAAEQRLVEIRELAAAIGTRGARAAALLAEARVAEVRGDLDTALRAAGEIVPLLPGDAATLAQAYALEARAHAAAGRLEASVSAGRLAVASIERLRGSLRTEPPAATLMADQSDIYGELVLALVRLERYDEAFAVADGGRSRSLLEHLSAVRTGVGVAREVAAADTMLAAIDRLVQRLRSTAIEGSDQRGGARVDGGEALEAELARARGEYEALLIRTAGRDSRVVTLLGEDAPTGLGELARLLGPREALIEYFIGPKLVIFVVTSRGLTVVDRDVDRDALLQRVRLLRDLWGTPTPSWRSGLPTARALYADLIAPAEEVGALSGIEQIYVVPHGILESVPFAALQDQAGHYLVERYATARLPSARALAALQGLEATVHAETEAVAFAPFPGALPSSGDEARAVVARLPRSSLRLRGRATEPNVRAALEQGAMVHVATHGVLNVRNPMFSRIELSRGREGGSSADGRLEVHEILGLTIRSPFVFLSGCETGASREWTRDPLLGSGESGLAQALLAAGARDVVSTLWRVDDAGAAAFAGAFYGEFGPADAIQALAGAQRALAATDGTYGSPFYWAPYTLSGLGSTRPQIGRSVP